MPAGRKDSYKRNVADQWDAIMELCRQGATNKEIACFIGVAENTIYEYFKRHPEFDKALHEIRHKQVIEVKNALLKKAMGYTYEKKKKYIKTDKKGNESVYTEITQEEIPPDPRAIAMWLRNYDPDYVDADGFTRKTKEQEMKLREKMFEKDNW